MTEGLMKEGEEVVWRHIPRGGWCFVQLVPAVIEGLSQTRVRIRVQKRDGTWVSRYVKPESLRPKGYQE